MEKGPRNFNRLLGRRRNFADVRYYTSKLSELELEFVQGICLLCCPGSTLVKLRFMLFEQLPSRFIWPKTNMALKLMT